jgi:hypothetical protein
MHDPNESINVKKIRAAAVSAWRKITRIILQNPIYPVAQAFQPVQKTVYFLDKSYNLWHFKELTINVKMS